MYIYEHKKWWQFRYDEKVVLPILSEVRMRQGELLGKLAALGFSVQNKAILDNLSLDIIKSSEIEGETLNLEHVRSSIARRLGLEEAGMDAPSRYVEGIVDMMMDATQNYQQPLTDDRLFGWHNVLFPTGRSGLYAIDVAQYRTHEMQVVSGAMGMEKVHYQALKAELVPQEMARLLQWINEDTQTESLIKAAITHLWFVSIHPFDDGNGRIARAITELLLARSDKSAQRFYSMSNAICANRKAYYDILERVQHGNGDVTEWIVWFLNCLNEAFEHSAQTLNSAIAKNQFWERHQDIAFNARQQKILNLLLDGFEGNLTTGRWSRICHCSRDTALKDATDLVKKGILHLSNAGGRSTHYVL